MTAPLYSVPILRLATSIPLTARLQAPGGSAGLQSPVCGSRVEADVTLGADGRVAEFGQTVRACALGQAAAAILGGGVLGRTPAELRAAQLALAAWLKGGDALPADLARHYPDLSLFQPARAHPGRHASICLAFDAAALAAERAAGQPDVSFAGAADRQAF